MYRMEGVQAADICVGVCGPCNNDRAGIKRMDLFPAASAIVGGDLLLR